MDDGTGHVTGLPTLAPPSQSVALLSTPVPIARRKSRSKSRRRLQQNRFSRFQVGPSNIYVTMRDGQVLGSRMILKADLFPSGVQRSLPLHLSGANNFRQVPSLPIYSVAQPTEYGIRTVLNIMKLGPMFNSHRQTSMMSPTIPYEAVWVNLREEPVMYLNNRPFVLRELDHPFRNMQDFRGLDAEDIRDVERRLKADILREATHGRGNVLLHEEANDVIAVLRTSWESLSEVTIRTSDEVYEGLKTEGYEVDYHRVPITPEDVPEAHDFDSLVAIFLRHVRVVHHQPSLSRAGQKAPSAHLRLPNIIFNCQRGTGRSILGIVIMYLTRLRVQNELSKSSTATTTTPTTPTTPMDIDDEKAPAPPVSPTGNKQPTEPQYREYSVIIKLARMLRHGAASKLEVDRAVVHCSDGVHSLHKAIAKAVQRAQAERDDTNLVALDAAAKSLLRYFMLICFQSYLEMCAFDVKTMKFEYSFQHWMETRPELWRLADLTRDPTSWQVDASLEPLAPVDKFVYGRQGSVLNQRTVLKSEYFRPSADRSAPFIEAPHFRVIDGLPVAATGQPTMAGMRVILDELGALVADQQFRHWRSVLGNVRSSDQGSVLWINFREEPILYIRGLPYVLREVNAPFRSMAEFSTGMSPQLLHNLEARLKDDIVNEWKASDGRLLLHQEKEHRKLSYEHVVLDQAGMNQIYTSAEVFAELKRLGYRVEYHRIPLTVGKTPDVNSFDNLYSVLDSNIAKKSDILRKSTSLQVVFNCYKGGRRSAMGMVMTTLLLKFHGFPVDDIVAAAAVTNRPSRQAAPPVTPRMGVVDEEEDDDEDDEIDIEMTTNDKNTPAAAHSVVVGADVGGATDGGGVVDETVFAEGIDRTRTERTQMSRRRGEYKGILALIRILPNGARVKEEVDDAIDLCGGTYNLRDTISEEVFRTENQRMNAAQASLRLNRAINYLESYAYLICFQCFLQEKQRFRQKVASSSSPDENKQEQQQQSSSLPLHHAVKDDMPFSEWIGMRPELVSALENIRKDADENLKVGSFSSADEFASLYASRCGNVLTAGAIIKNDYFVGCRSDALPQNVKGTINFRQVVGGLPIAGNGAPTAEGIMNVVVHMASQLHHQVVISRPSSKKMRTSASSSSSSSSSSAASSSSSSTATPSYRGVWLNMREEPVVYLNFHPYVLRDFDKPYVNLENTGITAKRVQAMEKQLKIDVLQEIEKNKGQILLHDEDQDGNLIAVKQYVSPEVVHTPNEVYTMVFQILSPSIHLKSQVPGIDSLVAMVPKELAIEAVYCRMPITDEQAPSVESFDEIVATLEATCNTVHDAGSFFVTNCQMGRGRTTTTMIITYLWYMHRNNGGELQFSPTHKSSKPNLLMSDGEETDILHDGGARAKKLPSVPSENYFEQRLMKGEYKIIQALVRLLKQGVRVKEEVDAVIDHCDHMQNLRTAIYDLVVKAQTAVVSRRPRFVHQGSKYLARYFFLICYNAYFRDEAGTGFKTTFKTWYENRPELQNVLEKYEGAFPPTVPPPPMVQAAAASSSAAGVDSTRSP